MTNDEINNGVINANEKIIRILSQDEFLFSSLCLSKEMVIEDSREMINQARSGECDEGALKESLLILADFEELDKYKPKLEVTNDF